MQGDQEPPRPGLFARLWAFFRKHRRSREEKAAYDKIIAVIKQAIRGGSEIDSSAIAMIASVLEFSDKVVREVMVPRVDMVCVELGAGVEELKQVMANEGHSRVPIFDGTVDKIVGVVHVRDLIRQELLQKGKSFGVAQAMMKPFVIPETKKIKDLLATFRTDRNLMAIVVDEYGGTAGLVTIEDLLEEIVGEIRGEFEPELEEPIKVLDAKTIVADGKVDLDQLREHVKFSVDDSDFDTLGGFILDQLGSVPSGQESFEFDGLRFTVLEADERRVRKVKIERLQPEAHENNNG